MAKKKRRSHNGIVVLLLIVLVLAAALLGWMVYSLTQPTQQPPAPTAPTTLPTETTQETEPETTQTEPPEPEHVVSRATIVSTGDLLMHSGLIKAARQGDGSYDFSYIFPYLTEYISAADFAVANLETTLAGTAKPYQGNPMFNCPDAIVDAAKDAGFDMLLTANNHSYDSQQPGFDRTLQVVRGSGLLTLGTMLDAEEPKYAVQEINGISVGMICYTYEDSLDTSTPPALNYNPMQSGGYQRVNCFRHANPEPFYQEMEERIGQMKADGAEAIVVYLHWGQEYHLEANQRQKDMAQRLCDLGVDVIVGGHPHVVEPVELLTSTQDPEHTTVCLYSMGNAVSNQRRDLIKSRPDGYTEDGVLFSVTFCKYSDGTVYLEDAQLIPTWVRAVASDGSTVIRSSAAIARYEILPLDDSLRTNWQELFGLDDKGLTQTEESWQRTVDITGAGMAAVQEYLAAQQTARDWNYRMLVQ